jgi:pimeloyl-ACP methyl ester carboxylesterase
MKTFLFCLIYFVSLGSMAQTTTPDLTTANLWQLYNREASSPEAGITELNGKPGDGMMILKGSNFSDGTITLKIKGENKPGASFVGLAFHIRDEKRYEAVYFRPFNFKNNERQSHSVQYVSIPDNGWETLRTRFPGKYENKINPAPEPDAWIDAKIIVKGKSIKVFANGSTTPCLEVESLSGLSSGAIGLWVGNNSKGSFKDLRITADKAGTTASIPYGNNPEAGKYFDAGDVKLYYEVYGKGEPIALLHGGVFGYIDEFSQIISDLSRNYQVICLATRGHGKSYIGNAPYTYKQRAEDAYKLIRTVTKDSVTVLGFSDGGYAASKLAATYPELVKKLVVIGAGEIVKGSRKNQSAYSAGSLLQQYGDFFKTRLALMPEPDRWNESLQKLNVLYNTAFMSDETFKLIRCPALIMSGDRDQYVTVNQALKAKEMIPNSRLSIIAGCPHVVFYCNYPAVKAQIEQFLNN